MATSGRVSASKARAITRKKSNRSSASIPQLITRLWYKAGLLAVTIVVSCFIVAVRPPPPRICGTPNGPPVTAPRIRLSDGRYLAYKEAGVPKQEANYKIVVVHAYSRSRQDLFPVSKETIERLGIYLLGYDRAGYGQSDPNPRRNVRSEAHDIEELADALELGPKFFLLSYSIGGHAAWGCLRYIPHRLAGVTMVVPVVNYWWPSLQTPEGKAVFRKQPIGDRIYLSVAHYAPWLTYWWLTQKILPTSTTVDPQESQMCPSDWKIRMYLRQYGDPRIPEEAKQQGIAESMVRDSIVMFGNWEFDPTEVENPGVPVHVWQGIEDFLVPVELQRMIMNKLPWIHYHEVPKEGHYLNGIPGLPDKIVETMVTSSQ